ncbi:MAG TPA: hypothetical protein VEH62_02955 [Gemmatimonadales bacterium]|nr:hypothetical protein [Gemmatimonadales bacterium]
MSWLVAFALALGAAPRGQSDSLMVAAQRAAAQWTAHEFTALVGSGEAVMVHLPGAEPSSPLRPAQAAALLGSFAEGTRELDLVVLVVRKVDPDRAYVEAQRVFEVRGTDVRHAQTLYFGFRRVGAAYHLVEVRALP